MKPYFFLLSFLVFVGSIASQTKSKAQRLKPGDKVEETFTFYKDSVTSDKFEIPIVKPSPAFLMFYRFGEINGARDNYDSVYKVVCHVYRLNRYFGPYRKPSRLTCAIFVKEVNAEALALKVKINSWSKTIGDSMVKTERAGFNFNRPWQVVFIKEKEVSPSSILAANKVSIIAADGQLMYSSPIGAFKFNGKKGSVQGKILTEKQSKKIPVPNAMVTLLNLRTGKEEPDSAMTDIYGDFELGVADEDDEYSIIVKSKLPDLETVILATQSGQEISRLRRTARGFEYKLIPNDLVLLTEKENEDISLVFSKFGGSKKTDLKVTENILYQLGQYSIDDEESKRILDKVAQILKENPKVTLEIISHTDAQGDDASNMILSEKRSGFVTSYFISKGVDKSRLKAIGKGEMELRNRCTNGVDCSDKEHEYNRRTEFKFTKG